MALEVANTAVFILTGLHASTKEWLVHHSCEHAEYKWTSLGTMNQ